MRVVISVVLVALIVGGAAAATYTLGDTLTVIQRPIQNVPSIVRPGDQLPISCEATPSTTGWTASLVRGPLEVPLTIDAASYDPATEWWTLAVTTPAMPVFDLYDLRVTASGGLDDTTRDAVKAIPEFRDTYEVIHITDPHIPTYKYYYQDGAQTDSTTSMALRDITEDINIINPEFVLLTGDFVNEGELEDYLGLRYYSRAQMHLNEFDVPVFLTSGNHDLGGWDDTPPSDGTARRDWWRFFGWRRLSDPPVGAPARTQDYSFDYGPINYIGLEAYDNYDSWRYSIYGAESFTSDQMDWLEDDIAAASSSVRNVLFFHEDFDNELNFSSLGVDVALSGHIHYDIDDTSYPMDIVTDNAGGTNRPFRLLRISGDDVDPRPTLEAEDPDRLRVIYSPANDGTNDFVSAQLRNSYGETFPHALVRIAMPPADNYIVTGGTLTQVDATADPAICYVEVNLTAQSNVTVTVEADRVSGSPTPAATPRLSVHPNPFNPCTEIAFTIDEPAACRMTVFDLQGRTLAVLLDDHRDAGRHTVTWHGTSTSGDSLASGTYLLGMQAGSYSETRKITLVR